MPSENEFEDCLRDMPPHLRGLHNRMHKIHRVHPPHVEILDRLEKMEELLRKIHEKI